MLHSAAKSFAPPVDGFSYAGFYCFRLSASHLHCALKHLHPFNLQQNSVALLHFSRVSMCGVISIVYLPYPQKDLRYSLPILWRNINLYIMIYDPT